MLEGEVEVGHDLVSLGDRLEQRGAELGRLQVGEPDAFDAIDACQRGQHRLEEP